MMLLKAVGCVFVLVFFWAVGVGYINVLKKRISGLEQMIELLTVLKIKLEYELCSIPELFNALKQQQEGKTKIFLEYCLTRIADGSSLKKAWNESVDFISEEMCFIKSDVILMKDFAQSLGDTDISGQIANLTLFIELLKKNLSEAEKILKDKSRVTMSCSLFGGLLISILLI